MATKTYYAWSEIRNGGEVDTIELIGGGTRKVLKSRNVVMPGEKITQKSLGLSDEDWERMIEGGSIRDYPMPEDVDDHTSPASAVMSKLLTPSGDLDVNMLMELGLSHPPAINPPADEGTEVPEGA